MQKETKTMKALIIKSGPQTNGFSITKDAIRKIYAEKNDGKPLVNRIGLNNGDPCGKICGYLAHTELIENNETSELELWGYYTYAFDEIDFSKEGFCSYSIAYNLDDMVGNSLQKCSLVGCMMVDKEV